MILENYSSSIGSVNSPGCADRAQVPDYGGFGGESYLVFGF
jgi:hypothetical protein